MESKSGRHLSSHLKRFFDGNLDAAEMAVRQVLSENPDYGPSQVFFFLSAHKGNPSTHCSAYADSGKLKGS
jgi:hypothetical protein